MVGTSLGHYEVVGTLGSGGMGDVYVAEDVHLGRKVALKVLSDEFASDAKRYARFEREAKLLAALNHANVATLYGFEHIDGVAVIAMELVEGETLQARLARSRGGLDVRDALEVARQIAEGLEAAHHKGIVHRDLKPTNVMITPTGTAKILDFGIAKPKADTGTAEELASALTTDGLVVGTPHYMSPEQIRGEPVDQRADIWAFGCVLFELLAGRAPFARETVADSLAAVLEEEVDCELLPLATPELVCGLLRRCLSKDPEHRLHDIADARIELDEALDPDMRVHRASASRLPWLPAGLPARVALGAALVLIAGGALWTVGDRLVGERPLPAGQPYAVTNSSAWQSQPAISPDGSRIAFSADPTGNRDIYIVSAEGGEPVPLVQHPAADTHPTWFPNGDIAFDSDRDGSVGIWRVGQLGGGATLLVPGAGEPDVSPDGSMIAFTRPVATGVLRIGVAPVDDPGSARIITTDDDGLWDHTAPSWSPDGSEIAYSSRDGLRVVRVTGGGARALTRGGHYDLEPQWSYDGRYVYFSSARGGPQAIWRVRANGGRPAEQVTMGMGPESHPSLSRDGRTLVYATGATQRELVLRDRQSASEVVLSDLPEDLMPAFAPDSSAVVYTSRRWGLDTALWVQRLREGVPSEPPFRLAESAGIPSHPTFSPDGRWIAYYRILGETRDIFVIPAAGGPPVAITEDSAPDYQPAWSPDGTQLVFVSERSQGAQLWLVEVRDGRRIGVPRQLTHQSVGIMAPAWSRDGALISYVTSEGEQHEVWVVAADGSAAPRRVTSGAEAFRVRWDATPGCLLVSGRWDDPREVVLRRVSLDGAPMPPVEPPVRFGPDAGLFDVSADGRFLVFSRGALEGDVWVLRAVDGHY